MADPATDSQLMYLANLGVMESEFEGLTVATASALITGRKAICEAFKILCASKEGLMPRQMFLCNGPQRTLLLKLGEDPATFDQVHLSCAMLVFLQCIILPPDVPS